MTPRIKQAKKDKKDSDKSARKDDAGGRGSGR